MLRSLSQTCRANGRRSLLALAFALLSPEGFAQLSWAPYARGPSVTPFNHPALAYDLARGRTVLFVHDETWESDGTTWSQRLSSPSPRVIDTALLAYDSRRSVTVLLGIDRQFGSYVTWEWDGASWTRRFPFISPRRRIRGAMVYHAASSRVLLFGGFQPGGTGVLLNDTWEWDGDEWRQQSPATRPSPRAHHAMAYDVVRARTVLFGGTTTPDTWEWDGTNWVERIAPIPVPDARADLALTYDASRQATLLYGGRSTGGQSTERQTWEWNGVRWSRLAPASDPTLRRQHALSYDLARGRAVLVGGARFDTWEWDGASWAQVVPTHPLSPDHRNQALAYDSQRRTAVLFETSGGNRATFEWTGSSWAMRPSQASPPGAFFHALAYDSTRSRVVCFSPVNESTSETWEWDGVSWERRASGSSPGPRSEYALAYDSGRSRLVLFGGKLLGTSNLLSETWEWDGTAWLQLFPPASPPPRAGHSLAFDAARGRVVLFGGTLGQTPASDTWEWDGVVWTPQFPASSPPARYGATMAFDSTRGRVVLFGGIDGAGIFLNDTWEWDGAAWAPSPLTASPTGRYFPSMAYDEARRQVLLFGGLDGTGSLAETWQLGGPPTLTSITPSAGSELGDDRIGINGNGFTSLEDTSVTVGGAAAQVVSVGIDRVGLRTPPGRGVVDIVVANAHGSTTLPTSFTYVEPAIAARWGNVNVALGDRENVLRVNGDSGSEPDRAVVVQVHQPIDVQLAEPSSRSGDGGAGSRFVLYGWVGPPTAGTLIGLPGGIGVMVLAPPFLGGRPAAIWNNVGFHGFLGTPTHPSSPAPSTVFRRLSGTSRPVTVTLQGIIEDDGSAIPQSFSITNAVILRVQP